MKELHKNHRARLRSRYQTEGLDAFADHMLLELLLFQSIPRVDTNPIGHRLLERFGTLDGVFAASEEELCTVEGVGPKTAQMLKAAGEHMLFRMLEDGGLSDEDFRLPLAAEYHMRGLPVGAVSLFSRERVFDYLSDGGAEGLCEAIRSDLSEYGITEYAVVAKADADGISEALMHELESGGFPAVFKLAGTELTKIE